VCVFWLFDCLLCVCVCVCVCVWVGWLFDCLLVVCVFLGWVVCCGEELLRQRIWCLLEEFGTRMHYEYGEAC
jgi:hypothetical protein